MNLHESVVMKNSLHHPTY